MLFKIKFVGAVPMHHFRLVTLQTFFAVLPVSLVSVAVMCATERIPAMITYARISCIRKHDVLVFVIAHPLTAALGFDAWLRLSSA